MKTFKPGDLLIVPKQFMLTRHPGHDYLHYTTQKHLALVLATFVPKASYYEWACILIDGYHAWVMSDYMESL